MKLLIVESPSKAKTINQYLGKNFIVTSSFGHVRGLPSAKGSVLPEEDFKMIYEISDKSKKHVSDIVTKVKKCDELYLATDPDREGEAIAWHILETLKAKKAIKDMPVKRVVFHEITKTAVLKAIESPRDIDMDLVQAQQARQALDYLYGFTLSPVLWRKLPGARSAGRVQSVALRLIADRELEIEKFVTEEFWSVTGLFEKQKDFRATLNIYKGQKLQKMSIKTEAEASEIKAHVLGKEYVVSNKENKQINKNAQPPFTTSTMLQEASRKLGFSAKKTSKIAQDLYEGIEINGKVSGLITYMRTDSVSISKDALEAVRQYINSEFGDKYLPKNPKAYKTKTKNAQEAHEAIRPTNVNLSPLSIKSELSVDQYKLYDLIWKRLVASQMQSAVIDQVAIDLTANDNSAIFRAVGSVIAFDGFYKIYKEDLDDQEDEDKQILPGIEVGDKPQLCSVETKQHFTAAPPRYTEASLVKKMEELGIGRPSTYPSIISILQEREYVNLDKKRFIASMKGRFVSAFLKAFFEQYVDYNFTAKLEDELDELSNGELKMLALLKQFWHMFKSKTDEAMKLDIAAINLAIEDVLANVIYKDLPPERICESCGTGKISIKFGKFGPFLACSNYPDCNFTKPLIAKNTGEGSDDGGAQALGVESNFPKVLGDENGFVISVRKGPYGFYVQKEYGKDIKRTSVPKTLDPNTINLSYALGLLSLPREVGIHTDGCLIKAGIGRYGPYLEHNKKFKSLKGYDPVTISLAEAISILGSEG